MASKDLHIEHKKDRISVTQLETFINCPKKFELLRSDDGSIAREEVLTIGKIFHLAMQSPKLAFFTMQKARLPVADYQICSSMIRAAQMFINASNIRADAFEIEVSAIINEVEVVGHIDEANLFSEGEDPKTASAVLIDNKTTAKAWNEEDYASKFQKVMYPYLFSLNTGIQHIDFIYRVVPKKKNVTMADIKEFRETIDLDAAKEAMQNAVRAYKTACARNDFIPVRSKQCFYCKYKKNGQCPAWDSEGKSTQAENILDVDVSKNYNPDDPFAD